MKNSYTYWVLPEPSTQKILETEVSKLAGAHAGPNFRPHMTLLGSFEAEEAEVLAQAEVVVEKLRGLMLSFGAVEFSTTYFQNVFVRIRTTAQLMDAFIFSRDLFRIDPDKVFMPHMSLLYGNHSMSEREEISRTVIFPTDPFKADLLVVTPSTPNPADWKGGPEHSARCAGRPGMH